MTEPRPAAVTELLARAGAGDLHAFDELAPLVYAELRRIAGRVVASSAPQQTLPPTALVNEAYLKLVDRDAALQWEGRRHFFAVAARVMRQVLIDHHRRRSAEKRGGIRERVTLDAVALLYEERQLDLLALEAALERLAELDPALVRVVELRFFAGLSIAEAAAALQQSTATVERAWRTARAWLSSELSG